VIAYLAAKHAYRLLLPDWLIANRQVRKYRNHGAHRPDSRFSHLSSLHFITVTITRLRFSTNPSLQSSSTLNRYCRVVVFAEHHNGSNLYGEVERPSGSVCPRKMVSPRRKWTSSRKDWKSIHHRNASWNHHSFRHVVHHLR
jgi:hypothetical protein